MADDSGGPHLAARGIAGVTFRNARAFWAGPAAGAAGVVPQPLD